MMSVLIVLLDACHSNLPGPLSLKTGKNFLSLRQSSLTQENILPVCSPITTLACIATRYRDINCAIRVQLVSFVGKTLLMQVSVFFLG